MIKRTEKLGQKHSCSKSCSSKLTNESRRCEPITHNSANSKRDKEKFPEKNHARNLVRQAIKSGKIIPPEECELCFTSETRLQGHHPDHSRPYLLVFLCSDCHHWTEEEPDKGENIATDYSGCIN